MSAVDIIGLSAVVLVQILVIITEPLWLPSRFGLWAQRFMRGFGDTIHTVFTRSKS